MVHRHDYSVRPMTAVDARRTVSTQISSAKSARSKAAQTSGSANDVSQDTAGPARPRRAGRRVQVTGPRSARKSARPARSGHGFPIPIVTSIVRGTSAPSDCATPTAFLRRRGLDAELTGAGDRHDEPGIVRVADAAVAADARCGTPPESHIRLKRDAAAIIVPPCGATRGVRRPHRSRSAAGSAFSPGMP